MTTVHPRDDSRILHKQIRTLAAQSGEKLALYVQDGLGDAWDSRNQCSIVDTGPQMRRVRRMTLGAWRMIRAVRRARPKLVFFHDPELMPWAALLRLLGIRVIYDVHENYPGQISRNPRIPKGLRRFLAAAADACERTFPSIFNGVIAVDPAIATRFPKAKTVVVRNSPIIDELASPSARPIADRPRHFGYVGTINEDRNIFAMVDAVHKLGDPQVKLRLAGRFTAPGLEERVKATPGWQSVIYDQWLSRDGVRDLLADVRAGLLLIKPIEHEMHGMPIKMCEYMAAGIPIIASDFPHWRDIIESAGAGITVDPMDRDAIARALGWMLDNPEKAAAMGRRGRQAVLEKYNWDIESKELLRITRRILDSSQDF